MRVSLNSCRAQERAAGGGLRDTSQINRLIDGLLQVRRLRWRQAPRDASIEQAGSCVTRRLLEVAATLVTQRRQLAVAWRQLENTCP